MPELVPPGFRVLLDEELAADDGIDDDSYSWSLAEHPSATRARVAQRRRSSRSFTCAATSSSTTVALPWATASRCSAPLSRSSGRASPKFAVGRAVVARKRSGETVEIVNAQKLVVVDGETVELTHGSERVLVRFAPAPALQCPRATSPTRDSAGAFTGRPREAHGVLSMLGAFWWIAQYNDARIARRSYRGVRAAGACDHDAEPEAARAEAQG